MADYTAADLLVDGQERYGVDILRNRMRGALADTGDADAELLEIAESVFNRVRTAALPSIGWPFPGSDDEANLYREKWPGNILQKALELFNYRTLSVLEDISEDERKIGMAAEKFFDDLERGGTAWGIGGTTDIGPGRVLAARSRDGTSNIASVSDRTRATMLDAFRAGGWDWVQ